MSGQEAYQPTWRVDLHTHTRVSKDSLTEPEAFVSAVRRAGLDRVAVTDHNRIDGARAVQQLAPELIIVGEEINTGDGGELLAYFVQELVPRDLPMREALARLREQGAVISVSHPLDRYRHSAMGRANTLAIIDLVDALEVFNARCLAREDNDGAARLADQHGKLITAGSDGHTIGELGAGYLLMPPFELTPASFMASLREAQPGGHLTGYVPHLWSTYAKLVKRLS